MNQLCVVLKSVGNMHTVFTGRGVFRLPKPPTSKMLISIRILATKLKILTNIQKFNLRPGGEGVILTTPTGFSQIAKKRRRAAPSFFCIPFYTLISHPSRKFQPKVISGQVTRSGQVTLPKKIFKISPWLQFLRYQFETFRSWLRNQYLQNSYIGILISVTRVQVNSETSPL